MVTTFFHSKITQRSNPAIFIGVIVFQYHDKIDIRILCRLSSRIRTKKFYFQNIVQLFLRFFFQKINKVLGHFWYSLLLFLLKMSKIPLTLHIGLQKFLRYPI